jgi:hypothetical protein
MRKFFLLILLIFSISILCASDYTDKLLDDSIEEFSKKNYNEALTIIDTILDIEPDNDIAIMYKKTIEDVVSIDNEIKAELEATLINSENKVEPVINENLIVEGNDLKVGHDIISATLQLGQNSDGNMIVNYCLALDLGLPIINFGMKSDSFDYDIADLTLENPPVEDIFNSENYSIDLNIGLRYRPFPELGIDAGYFDIEAGVTNYSNEEYSLMPFVGFDTELFLLSAIDNNFLFNNIWFGCNSSLYFSDDSSMNNFNTGLKAGFRAGSFYAGWFYSISHMDYFTSSLYNSTAYGLSLGVKF